MMPTSTFSPASTVRPSIPRFTRRRASTFGSAPLNGFSRSTVRPLESKCTRWGPYSSDTQKVPSESATRPSLSIPWSSYANGLPSTASGISPVPPAPGGSRDRGSEVGNGKGDSARDCVVGPPVGYEVVGPASLRPRSRARRYWWRAERDREPSWIGPGWAHPPRGRRRTARRQIPRWQSGRRGRSRAKVCGRTMTTTMTWCGHSTLGLDRAKVRLIAQSWQHPAVEQYQRGNGMVSARRRSEGGAATR
jgi:hypothetical protein